MWVDEAEISGMAKFLNISIEDFKRKYVRTVGNRMSLIEKKSQHYDCVFLKDKKCMVYLARPVQCRTFPWWKGNLATEEHWRLASEHCEGINDEAPIIPYSQIVQLLRSNEGK